MPSVSKSQQRLMGVAYAVKSGDMELSDVDPAYRDKVKSLSDGMTKKDLKKYASTKHDELPETVDEAFIGPFVFNDSMSDEELLGMYNGALDGYANYAKGMHYSKSDYKKAYQEIEKILKKRGVSVDENAMGAISLNPGMTIGGIGDPALPTATEFGSGDVPAVADIDDDEEEAKKDNTKKKLEMENFNLYTQFSSFVNEKFVNEAFKFGKKNQYTIDDVNEAYGFWGTLELGGFKRREIEDCWHSAMAWLTESYRFSDAGALYYLNAKAGRWIADQVIEQKGNKDVVDVLEDYATDAEWKKWSKEYNKFAQEEMMSEATDFNDPVLIRLRQDRLRRADMAKLDALKKEAEKDRKKAMRRWNQKKYDQWLEDVASNGGWENAFDMAQNAEFEPGLVDWVKKENPYDDAFQRIQWDIEAFAESVVTEAKLKFKVGDFIKQKKGGNLGYEIKSIDPKFDAVEVYLDVTGQSTKYTFKHINKEWELAESVVTEGFSNLKISGPAYDLWNDREVQRKLRGVKIRIVGDIDGVLTVRGHDDELQKVKDIDLCCIESVEPITEKKLDREDMMAWIEKSMDFVSTTEEFNGSQGGIWVSGEAGDEYKGRVIYDYYSEDYKNRTFGVDNRWEKELNKRGWYSEWHDAGTSMIWPL